MRRLLARLAFPFLVLAVVLAWEAYRAATGRAPDVGQGRVVVYVAGAALLLGLGLRGIRDAPPARVKKKRADPFGSARWCSVVGKGYRRPLPYPPP